MNNAQVVKVLRQLSAANNGILLPEHVVDHARDKASPLHSHFCWDNTEAAKQFRLHQARNLIRVVVTLLPGKGETKRTQVFVSLTPDRARGGGYREVSAVVGNKDQYQQMLADAKRDMVIFINKYNGLCELSAILVDAIKAIHDKGKAA